jgi:hypothetical protein
LSSRPYSDGYAKEKGVSKSNVDLTLTGDMLENMFVKNVSDKNIEISVRNRDYGKLRGAEEGIERRVGKPDKNGRYSKTLVKRPFFRLSKSDIEKIKNNPDFLRTLERAGNRVIKENSK